MDTSDLPTRAFSRSKARVWVWIVGTAVGVLLLLAGFYAFSSRSSRDAASAAGRYLDLRRAHRYTDAQRLCRLPNRPAPSAASIEAAQEGLERRYGSDGGHGEAISLLVSSTGSDQITGSYGAVLIGYQERFTRRTVPITLLMSLTQDGWHVADCQAKENVH